MNFFRLMLALVALADGAIAAADANDPSKTASAVSTIDARSGAGFVAFYEKFADIVITNQNDCEKMAHTLDTYLHANKEVLAKGREAAIAGKQLSAMDQRHVAMAFQKLLPASQRCGGNPKVIEALDEIQH